MRRARLNKWFDIRVVFLVLNYKEDGEVLAIGEMSFTQRSARSWTHNGIRNPTIDYQEGNDCDFHLEIAGVGKGKAAQRVIAEIPAEDTAAREQLLALLLADTRSKLLNAQPDSKGNYRKLNLTQAVPMKVTGYAFFDAHHYSVNWKNSKGGSCHFTPQQVHHRGSSHGTCYVGSIWELHPIWKVERVGDHQERFR